MGMGSRTALVAALLAAPRPALADPARPTPDLPWDPGADAPVTAFAAVAWILSEEAKPSIAPAACRWCDGSLDGLDASVRRVLLWQNTELASTLSDVAVFGVAPVSALGLVALAAWHDGHPENIEADAVIVLEASLLAMDVDQAVKYAAGRQRPYARFQDATVLAAGP